MNTNTQEALAKVASISSMIDSFAKSMATQRIDVYPITMIGNCNTILDEDEDYVRILTIMNLLSKVKTWAAVPDVWTA